MLHSGADPSADTSSTDTTATPCINWAGSQPPAGEGKVSDHPACLEVESLQLSDLQH